jgi:hypothetical protein
VEEVMSESGGAPKRIWVDEACNVPQEMLDELAQRYAAAVQETAPPGLPESFRDSEGEVREELDRVARWVGMDLGLLRRWNCHANFHHDVTTLAVLYPRLVEGLGRLEREEFDRLVPGFVQGAAVVSDRVEDEKRRRLERERVRPPGPVIIGPDGKPRPPEDRL